MNIDYSTLKSTTDLSQISESIKILSGKVGMDYNELVKCTYKKQTVYEIPVVEGKAITTGLFKNKEVAVAQTEFNENTVFVNHVHEEFEIIKVISGELHMTLGEDARTIKENEAILIPPYVVHDSFAPVHTVAIIITVPACPSWPEGSK